MFQKLGEIEFFTEYSHRFSQQIFGIHRMEELSEIVGSDYESYPAKSLRRRLDQKFHKLKMPKQKATIIVAKIGTKYKLLTFNKKNKTRAIFIKETRPLLDELDFVPSIICMDDPNAMDDPEILIEYIEGQLPDIQSSDFVKSFARGMAIIHNLSVSSLSVEKYNNGIQENLEYLVKKGALGIAIAERILEKLSELQPKTIRTSLVYDDQQIANFIIDCEKRVYFVDLDSFCIGITGHFLFRRNIYRNIDKELFRHNYIRAGGSEYVFKNEQFLTIACRVNIAANCLHLSRELPFWETRRKLRRYRTAKKTIEYLKYCLL